MDQPGASTHPTALELRSMLRRGEVTARELVEASLQRISALDQPPSPSATTGLSGGNPTTDAGLGAFVEVRPDLALAEADEIDRRIAATPNDERHYLPPLFGLPTAHKDLVAVRGFTTTNGSAAVPHTVAERDDPIALAVREAGAICLGKTQVPEFGIAGYSENLIAPPARNPYDPRLTAGGSSGGTAVAVATGMVPAAIGSDAGGSIRIPSGACGLIGLKPGRSAVPADTTQGEVNELGVPRMSVSGPMARTVRDAALFYDAILGAAHEPTLAAVAQVDELRGLRIGISTASPFESWVPILFDAAANESLQQAAYALEAAGHHVEQASIDYGDTYPEAFTTVWTQALTRIPFEPGAEARLGELAQWFLESARAANPAQVSAAVRALREFAANATRQWGEYDIILTPALATAPPATGAFWALGAEGDYRLQCEWAPQTSMANVTGLPAIVVPVGSDTSGLPRGVQLIGRMGSEALLLQLAAQLTEE